MTVVCPSCNGLGFRPGVLKETKRKEVVVKREFAADPCKACGGQGTQYVYDGFTAQPQPYIVPNTTPGWPPSPSPWTNPWTPNTSSGQYEGKTV